MPEVILENNRCRHYRKCEAICSSKMDPKKRKGFNFEEKYDAAHVSHYPDKTGGVLIIGLYPGYKEVERQENAVGTSGKLLKRMIHYCIRYLQEETKELRCKPYIYFSNMIQCSPRRGTDNVEMARIANLCSIHIRSIIERMKPNIILTMGESVAKHFLGRAFKTLIRQRALFKKSYNDFNGIPIYCTWNAARCINTEKLSDGINAQTQIKNDITEVLRAWIKISRRETERVLPASDIL